MITLIWVAAAFAIGILTGEYVSDNKIQAYQKVLTMNERYTEQLTTLTDQLWELIAVYQGEYSEDTE